MEPLEKRNLHQVLVDHFIDAILRDELPCGEKMISEVELANQLGVSRNMLREALKTLEIFGVIESRHGRGTYIADNAKQLIANIAFTKTLAKNQSVKALLETRIVIEPGLAQFAAARRTDEDIDRMVRSVSSSAFFDKDRNCLTPTFHLSIAKASKCEVLEKYMESIFTQLRYTDYYQLQSKFSKKYVAQQAEEHQQILDMIIGGSAESARQFTYAHLTGLYKVIVSLQEA